MLDKHAISDSPQATKSVHFGKIARFSMEVNVWRLNKYTIITNNYNYTDYNGGLQTAGDNGDIVQSQ